MPDDGADAFDEASTVPAPAEADHSTPPWWDEASRVAAPEPRSVLAATTQHENATRRYLAVGAMVILGVLAIGGLLGWLAGDRTPEQIQSFAVIFSPVVALLGPILGFYFSKGQR